MSKTKAKIFVFIILALAGLLFFGCEQKPIVEDINFLDDEINLLINQTYTPKVQVYPTYSSDYYLTSTNENIIKINGKNIEAVGVGSALIKAKASENENVESIINVTVFGEPSQLATPSISFNETNQKIYISPVSYANDYTLAVNDSEFNVTETQIDLQSLTSKFSNGILTLKVKANTISGSKVFESSAWSGEYKIFPISNANISAGKLKFDVLSEVDYTVSLNNENLEVLDFSAGVDLTALDAKFENQNVTVKIVGAYNGIKDGETTYFNNSISLPLKVLPSFTPQFSDSVISWAAAETNFTLTIKKLGEVFETATINTNTYNLTNLTKFNEIEANAVYTISVEPTLGENNKNLATTNLKNEVKFSKKQAPNVTAENNMLTWQGADNFEINETYNGKTTTFVSSTNQFGLNGRPSGVYNVSVNARAERVGDIYYLSSNKSLFNIVKQPEVDLTYGNIVDHVLSFETDSEDNYLVYIDDVAHTISSYTNQGNILSVDFKTFADFDIAAGQHTIFVKHLGKAGEGNNAYFDSELTNITFVQLEEILNIEINEQIATVEITEANRNANISFVVTDGESNKTFAGETVFLDSENDAFFSAKPYSIYVKVEGDGTHTFSVFKANMAKREFTVLASPTLKVLNAEQARVSFEKIENALSCATYLNGAEHLTVSYENNYFDIDMLEGQTLNFSAKSLGDGKEYFTSKISNSISVSKLKSATVKYNSATNKLTATNPNDLETVLTEKPYTVQLNGQEADFNEQLNLAANANSTENVITIVTNAKVGGEDKFFINSDPQTLIINKIYEKSNYEIVDSYKLKITPENHNQQYNLHLKITVAGVSYEFDEASEVLQSGEYVLPFEYENGYYLISLQNNYVNILPITDNFTVQVMYKTNSTGNDFVAFSNYDAEQTISLISAPTVTRSEQRILISNLQNRQINNYKLLLNNQIVENFEAEIDNNYIYIDINNLSISSGENSLQAVILNPELNASLTIANLSNVFKFVRLPKTQLTATKNNQAEDNSVKVSFAAQTQDYADASISYVVSAFEKLGDDKNEITPMQFSTPNGSFRVDDLTDNFNFENEIYFVLSLTSTANYNGLELFNSEPSDELQMEKLPTCNNIAVDGNKLTFGIENNFVAGYDVYKQLESGLYEKINTNLILTKEYDLQNEAGKFNLKVRVVAVGSDGAVKYTNSGLSEFITVTKLNKPIVATENGEILINLPNDVKALVDAGANCTIIVKNVTTNAVFNLSLTGDMVREKQANTSYIIDPSNILNYNNLANELAVETLSFALKVEPAEEDEGFYLNSNEVTFDACGVFAPTNLSKASSDMGEYESMDNLSWQPNELNKFKNEDVNSCYMFKLVYGKNVYYSYDSKLKYKDGEDFYSYKLPIDANTIKFPYGYDTNGNGTVEDFEIIFDAGDYRFSVRSVPRAVADVNMLCSNYSYEYEFTILAKPDVYAVNGALAWSSQANATEYVVTVYNHDFTSLINSYSLAGEVTRFEFSNDFEDGLYAVTVQAISTKDNILNSRITDKIYVYRLQTAAAVSIDDGAIVLEANKFFTYAELEFVDANNRVTKIDNYNNTSYAAGQMSNFNIASFKQATPQDIAKLTETRKYIISINDSTVLALLQGGNYTVNAKLIGNSNSTLPIISSKQNVNISSIKAAKLKTTLTQVGKGKFKFLINTNDINTSAPNTTTLDLNYNFKGETNEFLKHAPFYKITITITNTAEQSSKIYEIYALDYYAFDAEIKKSDSLLNNQVDYELSEFDGLYARYIYQIGGQSIYFNVFENNTINLKDFDNLFYYPLTVTLNKEQGDFSYSSASYDIIPVAQGGTISLVASVLGGDLLEDFGYLTSDDSNAEIFERYEEITATGEEGKLKFKNLQKTKNGVVTDYPIYQLNIYKNGVQSNPATIYLYYNGKLDDAKKLTGNADDLYLPIENGNIVGDYIVYDISPYLEIGVSVIRIRTLAGFGTGADESAANYLLDAKVPDRDYTCYKLADVIFAIENGELVANLAYTSDQHINYANFYEISITSGQDGRSFVYQIDINDISDPYVRVENGKFYYVVPQNIREQFELITGETYSIKVRAMGGENANLINGGYYKSGDRDVTINFQKAAGINAEDGQAISVKEGALSWTNSAENPNITIKIVAEDGVGQLYTILVSLSNEEQYYLLDTYAVVGSKEQITLDGSQNLTVQIMVRGNSISLLNSDYSIAQRITRLNRVNNLSVSSYNGKLTWEGVNSAENYTIELVGPSEYSFTTDQTEFDFDSYNLEVGSYVVYITANGNDSILTSAKCLAANQFKKLDVVKSVSVKGDSLTWEPVADAQGYKVSLIYNGADGGELTFISTVTATKLTLPDNLAGQFKIKIQAVGYESGYVFNGNEAEFDNEVVRPEAINEIYFNDEHSIYYWTAAGDAQEGDSFIISYDMQKFKLQGNDIITEASTTIETTSYNSYLNYYYFEPTVMGIYSNFSVKVVRNEIYSSIKTFALSETINMFSAGSGVDDDPYLIKTANELMNIALKQNMKFKLINTIDLTNETALWLGNLQQGFVVSDEFFGTLNGNNNTILLPDVNVNVTSFGLFNRLLTGASVTNLTIGQNNKPTAINITLENEANDLYYGVLAGTISGATIKDVNICNFAITLTGSTRDYPKIYVGAIAGKAENGVLEGVAVGSEEYVGLSVNYELITTGTTYVAGILGEAVNSKITLYNLDVESTKNSFANFTLTSTSASRLTYVAGAVAQFTGSDKSYGVFNTEIVINLQRVNPVNLGGIVANAENIAIASCKLSGNIAENRSGRELNVGGMVAIGSNVTISDTTCNINFEFGLLSLNRIYLGVVAGKLSNSTVTSCHTNIQSLPMQTSMDGSSVSLGAYAEKDSGSTIDISYLNG